MPEAPWNSTNWRNGRPIAKHAWAMGVPMKWASGDDVTRLRVIADRRCRPIVHRQPVRRLSHTRNEARNPLAA